MPLNNHEGDLRCLKPLTPISREAQH